MITLVKTVVVKRGDYFLLLDILQNEAGVSRQGADKEDFIFNHSLHCCWTETDCMFVTIFNTFQSKDVLNVS